MDTDCIDDEKSDLLSMICNIIGKVQIKMGAYLWLLFILVNSTVFFDYGLSRFKNTISGSEVTTKGIMIQATILIILYLLLQLLVDSNIL